MPEAENKQSVITLSCNHIFNHAALYSSFHMASIIMSATAVLLFTLVIDDLCV